jgi:hypothetical protein
MSRPLRGMEGSLGSPITWDGALCGTTLSGTAGYGSASVPECASLGRVPDFLALGNCLQVAIRSERCMTDMHLWL